MKVLGSLRIPNGTSLPGSGGVGDLFFDTLNNILKIRNSSGWMSAGKSIVTTETGTSRTLVANDSQKWVRCTNAAAVTITVSTQASALWEDDVEITIEQAGAGQVTIVGDTGVTINTSLTAKTLGQYSVIGIKRVGTDVWTCVGERAAS